MVPCWHNSQSFPRCLQAPLLLRFPTVCILSVCFLFPQKKNCLQIAKLRAMKSRFCCSESLMNLSRVVVVYGLHMQVEIMDMVRLQVVQKQLQEKQQQQQLMSKTKMSQKLEEPQRYKVGMKRQASSIKDQDRQPPPHSCLWNTLWKSLLQKLPPLQPLLICSNWKELHKHTCGN